MLPFLTSQLFLSFFFIQTRSPSRAPKFLPCQLCHPSFKRSIYFLQSRIFFSFSFLPLLPFSMAWNKGEYLVPGSYSPFLLVTMDIAPSFPPFFLCWFFGIRAGRITFHCLGDARTRFFWDRSSRSTWFGHVFVSIVLFVVRRANSRHASKKERMRTTTASSSPCLIAMYIFFWSSPDGGKNDEENFIYTIPPLAPLNAYITETRYLHQSSIPFCSPLWPA